MPTFHQTPEKALTKVYVVPKLVGATCAHLYRSLTPQKTLPLRHGSSSSYSVSGSVEGVVEMNVSMVYVLSLEVLAKLLIGAYNAAVAFKYKWAVFPSPRREVR